jgi:hypothetical protein
MLKKLLTTFIVLAATATAWAEGWKVTYVTNGCHDATITKSADGTMIGKPVAKHTKRGRTD